MSIIPVTVPAKKLTQTISATATSFKLNNIKSWNGVDLTPGDFGTESFAVFTNSSRTQIEVFKIDPATIASASITIIARGLDYSGGGTPDLARQYAWPSNDTTVQLGTDAPQLFRDFMSQSNTATITALHTYNVLPRSAQTPTDGDDFTTKDYVDGLTAPSITIPINQVAHGFVVGDVIRVSGVDTYTKAQANNNVNAEVTGIVTAVTDADNFKYSVEGVLTAGVPVATAGTVLFLSPTTPGALTATEPTTIGHVSLPLAIVTQSSVRMIFHKYRGAVLNTIGGYPLANETTAGMVEEATAAQIAAKTDVGETGARLFVPPSKLPDPVADVQSFTVDGTWIKPAKGNLAMIEVWGAGGSGGAVGQNSNGVCGGGAGGEYRSSIIPLSKLPASVSITIGIGGASVVQVFGGQTAGIAGTATSFGSNVIANGGAGGVVGTSTSFSSAGGGTGGISQFFSASENGGNYGSANSGTSTGGNGVSTTTSGAGAGSIGWATSTMGVGTAGTSIYGGNAGASQAVVSGGNSTGTAGAQKGGGGGAAASRISGTATSGKGGDGYCRVTVF